MNESESIPIWWYEIAQPHLDKIQHPHKGKKQATVMAVIQWRLLGIPVKWKTNPAVCSAQTWSSKWQHEPEIAAALHAITDAIGLHRQAKAAEAVETAYMRLREGTTEAVGYLFAILSSADTKDSDRLNAIKTILDRASLSTASKAPQPATRDDVEEAIAQVYGQHPA